MAQRSIAKGTQTIGLLAHRFPQLYVGPAEGAEEANRLAARRGRVPEAATLDHFLTDDADELLEVQTPAGPVEVLFLKRREDFETFLQVVGHRSEPVPIARTIGAITYRGLADWSKVVRAYTAYEASGGTDWAAEFARLARTPEAFRAELVVVSEGPYSNVRADQTPYGADEWLRVSRDIRLNHECAHVVCRRRMPENVLPVWDEVTADVVGLLCACSTYDAGLASRFLGVTAEGFVGGRLVEYLTDDQRDDVDAIAREAHAAIGRIALLAREREAVADPFSFLLELKRDPVLAY